MWESWHLLVSMVPPNLAMRPLIVDHSLPSPGKMNNMMYALAMATNVPATFCQASFTVEPVFFLFSSAAAVLR